MTKDRKIHLSNIPLNITENFILHIFQTYGEVENVHLCKDDNDDALYAFVTFSCRQVALEMLKKGKIILDENSMHQFGVPREEVGDNQEMGEDTGGPRDGGGEIFCQESGLGQKSGLICCRGEEQQGKKS